MKTAFEFLKHFTEDLRIYPDGTSDKEILQMRTAILKAMENFAKQEVNEALASKATAILPHVVKSLPTKKQLVLMAEKYVMGNKDTSPFDVGVDAYIEGYTKKLGVKYDDLPK